MEKLFLFCLLDDVGLWKEEQRKSATPYTQLRQEEDPDVSRGETSLLVSLHRWKWKVVNAFPAEVVNETIHPKQFPKPVTSDRPRLDD